MFGIHTDRLGNYLHEADKAWLSCDTSYSSMANESNRANYSVGVNRGLWARVPGAFVTAKLIGMGASRSIGALVLAVSVPGETRATGGSISASVI